MVSNWRHVCSIGWPLKGKLLHNLEIKRVNYLCCSVARGCDEVCSILAEVHVLDVSIMYPVLSCDLASLHTIN